jgi:GT2 family glycosyltransferase
MKTNKLVGTGKLASFSRGFVRVHASYVGSANTSSDCGRPFYSAFAGGGSAMFDKDKFEELGGFDELLSPYYWEDVELSYRAWKRGYKVLYEPAATATHRISSTIGKLDRRSVRIIQQRNRLLFHWVHVHDRRLLVSHLAWLTLLTLTAPIRLQPWFLVSCLKAIASLPRALHRRAQEKRAARLSDRAIFELFDELRNDPAIFPYDRYQDLVDRCQGQFLDEQK